MPTRRSPPGGRPNASARSMRTRLQLDKPDRPNCPQHPPKPLADQESRSCQPMDFQALPTLKGYGPILSRLCGRFGVPAVPRPPGQDDRPHRRITARIHSLLVCRRPPGSEGDFSLQLHVPYPRVCARPVASRALYTAWPTALPPWTSPRPTTGAACLTPWTPTPSGPAPIC